MTEFHAGPARAEPAPGSIGRVLAVRHAVPGLDAGRQRYAALGFEAADGTIRLAGGDIVLAERTVDDAGTGLVGLTLGTDDVGAAALALASAGIATSGARLAHGEGAGDALVTRHLVVDGGHPERPDLLPEGRVEVAECGPLDPPPHHPNGATRLAAVRLRVPLGSRGVTADRYARLLDRWPRPQGGRAVFDLAGTSLVIGEDDELATDATDDNGQQARFVGLEIVVPEPREVRRRARAAEVPVVDLPDDGVLVPASAAFGAELAFVRAVGRRG